MVGSYGCAVRKQEKTWDIEKDRGMQQTKGVGLGLNICRDTTAPILNPPAGGCQGGIT